MKYTYELVSTDLGDTVVKRLDEDGKEAWIPLDPGNSDYQRYLRWLENPDADESGTL